jgi:hypothetical protein
MDVFEPDPGRSADSLDLRARGRCVARIDDAELTWQNRLLDQIPHRLEEKVGPIPRRDDEARSGPAFLIILGDFRTQKD